MEQPPQETRDPSQEEAYEELKAAIERRSKSPEWNEYHRKRREVILEADRVEEEHERIIAFELKHGLIDQEKADEQRAGLERQMRKTLDRFLPKEPPE